MVDEPNGTPSITYNGWLLPLTERLPRIITLEEPPKPEELLLICTPAVLPANAFIILGSFTRASSSPFTTWVEYVSDFSFFAIPNAVTTTSSSSLASFFNVTLIVPGVMGTSCVIIPTKDTCRIFAPAGASVIVNLPSKSVTAPVVLPFTNTEAPIIGSLSSAEITIPVMGEFWAATQLMAAIRQTKVSINLFFISCFSENKY